MLLLDFMEACEGVTSDSSQGTAYIISSLDEINEKTFHLCFFPHNNRCSFINMVLVFLIWREKGFFSLHSPSCFKGKILEHYL